MILPSVRSRTLIGRDEEMQLLRDTRRSLSNGRGHVVLLGGDAGIGKSRLLAEFTQSLSGGRAPLYALGECFEYAPSAFGPVRQILRSLIRSAPWAAHAAPAPARRMLQALLPDEFGSPAGDHNGTPLERAELFSGVVGYIATIAAKRAVVLAIEDLHWADAASLELFVHLAGRIAGVRVMMVATYRKAGVIASHPLFAALARLSRIPNVALATLEPLRTSDMAALVAGALAGHSGLPQDRLRDVVARSEGNPLFGEELLKRALLDTASEKQLPISIRAIILERLAYLDAQARTTLDHAAVLGASFTASLLGLVMERPVETLAPVLQRLQSFDLIARDRASTKLRFRHALTREAVYGEIGPLDARQIHATCARIVASLPDAAKRLDELAYHTWEAGLQLEALRYNELAGADALQVGALGHAAILFHRALALAEQRDDDEARLRLLGRAAAASSQSCDFATSIATYTRLHDLQLARGDYDAAGIALLRRATDFANTNHGVEAMALLRAFLDAWGERLAEKTADHLTISLAYLSTTQEAYERVPELLGTVREPEALTGHPGETYWLTRLFTAERHVDRRTWLAAVEALRGLMHESHLLAHAQILHSIGQTALTFGHNDEAERSLDEAIAFDREHGLIQALTFARAVKVRLLHLQGRLSQALPLIRFTLDNQDMVAVRYQLMMGAPHVALALGDEPLARRCVDEEIFADTNDGSQVVTNARVSTAMAAWLTSIGRGSEGRRILAKAVDMQEGPFSDAQFWCMAASAVDAGRIARLRDLCLQGAANAQDYVMQATLPMVEAILAQRRGDTGTSRTKASLAAELFRGLRWPLHEAKALEVAGDGDAALALYRACDSFADIRRLEFGSPAGPSKTQVDRLSPRERDVAKLVARGHTNRAVAAELMISENTVEKHITKIYAKLNFATRSELAAYAARTESATFASSG
jgi:DNA-binding CsgD family transcriptional regulator/tetratricopeptide (TPR) repeat protein